MTVKNTRLGRVATSEAAASGPRRTTPSLPMKRASVNGSVKCSWFCSTTSAKKNSFHAEMNAKSAATTIPGASSGSTIARRIRRRPAPWMDANEGRDGRDELARPRERRRQHPEQREREEHDEAEQRGVLEDRGAARAAMDHSTPRRPWRR